jgi:hypothetical protein
VYLLWEQGVAGSNPATPTRQFISLSEIQQKPHKHQCLCGFCAFKHFLVVV